jgi:hypothetical protein
MGDARRGNGLRSAEAGAANARWLFFSGGPAAGYSEH